VNSIVRDYRTESHHPSGRSVTAPLAVFWNCIIEEDEMDVNFTKENLATLKHLADRQEILDCLTRALRAIDRFDRDLFLTCFHPEAMIDAGGYLNAAATVYDGSAALHEHGQTSTIHNLLNHNCEIDGDTAHCET
jgi:hypothetical protein